MASGEGNYKAVLLLSSVCLDALQESDQRSCKDLFECKRVAHVALDGADPESYELRDKLFAISGFRGIYPQVFIEKFGNYEFVGLWGDVEHMNEMDDLPEDLLTKHPEIKTFGAVFGGLVQQR